MDYQTDFLIIGSGIAGLCSAIHASNIGSVTLVTKKKNSESNTNYAQGGIACVLDPNDSFELHFQDTIESGNGVSHLDAVKILVEDGPDRIKELYKWGARFTTEKNSGAFKNLELGREGGHSRDRIVHAHDLTGKEVEEALIRKAKSQKNITIHENHSLVELITNHHLNNKKGKHKCFGAYVYSIKNHRIKILRAKTVILATGGGGQVYLHTTNPEIATGDGVACAFRAGAQISNMEFIQFHPTTLFHPDADSFLISEALRGYGAILKDKHGVEFMNKYHPMGSLAVRDIVARAIDQELKLSGEQCVYLDIRHAVASETKRRFPNIYNRCLGFNIDITTDLIPVVPASHYMCGGVSVDLNGNTSISGLYACGEVSNTGVHGANRLASNSLLEALVFSKRCVNDASKKISSAKHISKNEIKPWDESGTVGTEEFILISHNKNELRSIMWDYVGIVRSTLRLERALRRINLLFQETENFYRRTKISPQLLELRNMILCAKMIVLSAIKRKESRGLHYTTDYPKLNDRYWKRNTTLTR